MQPIRWIPPSSRVVYRGNNNANANGGLSYSNANNDASNSNTNLGSRLENNHICQSAYSDGDVFLNVVPRGMSLANSAAMRKSETSSERVEFGRARNRFEEVGPKD